MANALVRLMCTVVVMQLSRRSASAASKVVVPLGEPINILDDYGFVYMKIPVAPALHVSRAHESVAFRSKMHPVLDHKLLARNITLQSNKSLLYINHKSQPVLVLITNLLPFQ